MYHIIGTSGHVDHGKTALIEALTGINADRLPEEKKRGMTIDLGFAHFFDDAGEPVGVIDVPGHERFIRNMVSGAWSLSVAVLVVAGNEGWMQQSEDHARVLEAMGIPHIVCALTKIDLVETDVLDLAKEMAREELTRIFNKEIPIIGVSSVTGEGIEELKAVILSLLKEASQTDWHESGYLHIDRVFSVKGSGTVVTGSLSGGTLAQGDELTILPSGITTKVKGIQSYHTAVEIASPTSRVALSLQGVKTDEISRGCIVAKDPSEFQVEREYIIQFEILENRKIRNHMEVELATGSGHYIGKLHFLRTEGYARFVLEEAIAVSWLDICLFIQRGGYRILAKGRFIWSGETGKHFRNKFAQIVASYPIGDCIEDESSLRLLINGYLRNTTSREKRDLKRFLSKEDIRYRIIDEVIILEDVLLEEAERLKQMASRPGGVTRAEFLQGEVVPEEVDAYLIERALVTYQVIEREQVYLTADQLGGDYELSKLGKKIMKQLENARDKGLQLKEITDAGARKELRNLIRIEKVVPLEGDIYFSRERFDAYTTHILNGRKAGDVFSIPEAKDRTGLSRRYIIPLLNKMEEMGLVRRDGDNRVVL
ncbi:MAG: selenocysteine-specific translation elongation factor [Sphaerochaeta sp.]